MKTVFGATEVHPDYLARLRTSMRRAIGDAKIREQRKAAKGRRSAAVTITLDQVMAKLETNDYRCALTGLEFWMDEADQYGPSMPSIDRIDPDGEYADANVRVVLYGVNGLRGRGSDADMYRIAAALIDKSRPAHEFTAPMAENTIRSRAG